MGSGAARPGGGARPGTNLYIDYRFGLSRIDMIAVSASGETVVRELSAQRDKAREFCIRNADRILFGTDQVTADQRDFDFLASRFWVHRKMWETAYIGPSPIQDPELADPQIGRLALPTEILQKLYHDNAARMLGGGGGGV